MQEIIFYRIDTGVVEIHVFAIFLALITALIIEEYV
jgi:hypothetical protein